MQNIEKILKIDGSAATWADKWGKSIAAPDIMVGVKYTLLLDLRSVNTDEESGELLPVAQDEFNADSFYIALDADYDQTTIPKLLKTDGIGRKPGIKKASWISKKRRNGFSATPPDCTHASIHR